MVVTHHDRPRYNWRQIFVTASRWPCAARRKDPMFCKALSGYAWVTTALGMLVAGATTSYAQPAANTYYKVVNKTSGKCVDAAGGGTGNGTSVQQWACNTNLQQQWLFTATSGGYYQVGTRNA